MKALIRNSEILREKDAKWINWSTGAPLTNKSWCGGPYVLIENYSEKENDEE